MSQPTAVYHSYLVRLWQDSLNGTWHASTECVQTRAIVHFADLDTLFVFLRAQVAPSLQDPSAVRVVFSE